VAVPRRAQAQSPNEPTVRFEVREVADSTFAFDAGGRRWVRPGLRGIAVDPRRGDVLIARFEVVRVESGLVTALITGQTARVSTAHVAVLEQPPTRWYRVPMFWIGAAAGLLIGLAGGAATR
jgi:hypothetical protein